MKTLFVLSLALALVAAVSANDYYCHCQPPHFKKVWGVAHDTYGLAPFLDKFRILLGGEDNGNELGPIAKGHRSIDWDAAALPGVPDFMPPDSFNVPPATRGIVFSTKKDKFLVSNPGNVTDSPIDNRFSSINPIFPKIFTTFSANRLFTSVFSNKFIAKFFVAGSKIPAAVNGFGAVFTDVDKKHQTCIEYFDRYHVRLAKICAKPKNKGLSFAGIVFKKPIVAKVKVTAGNIAIIKGKFHKYGDFVVVDDLLFGEPQKLLPVYKAHKKFHKKFDFHKKPDFHKKHDFHKDFDFHKKPDFHKDFDFHKKPDLHKVHKVHGDHKVHEGHKKFGHFGQY